MRRLDLHCGNARTVDIRRGLEGGVVGKSTDDIGVGAIDIVIFLRILSAPSFRQLALHGLTVRSTLCSQLSILAGIGASWYAIASSNAASYHRCIYDVEKRSTQSLASRWSTTIHRRQSWRPSSHSS